MIKAESLRSSTTLRATNRLVQQDLKVSVSIKNVGHSTEDVIMISPLLVELKDANGRVAEWKSAYRTYVGSDQPDHCPGYMKLGAPLLGRSQQHSDYSLGEEYKQLAPGKYSMTVSFCMSGQQQRLVSNTIFLEVVP